MSQTVKQQLLSVLKQSDCSLQEASLGRFWDHYNNKEPIAFISGDRDENDKSENKANFASLKRLVSLAGFGYNRVKGGYVEEGGKRVDSENSLVIYGGDPSNEKRLYDLAVGLGKRFKQSSIMFIDSEQNVFWVSTRDDSWVGKIGAKIKLGKFKTNNINDFYTRIANKEFKFDNLVEQEQYSPSLSERQLQAWFTQRLDEDGDCAVEKWESQIVK